MVFLSGPRQAGKTTLARSLEKSWPKTQYLNFDSDTHRPIIFRQQWDRHAELVILDEFHKLDGWKRRIKGVYDTEGIPPRLLITGSARLDFDRRGGDSLAGRYFLHRLYPLSVAELRNHGTPFETLDALIRLGGFPEPFLGQSDMEARRWRQSHLERIVRDDVQDLEPVRDVRKLLLLIDLLRERVGSSVAVASLAHDLEISPHTAKHWIDTLEHMYVLFRVPPYHKNIARAILKEPKIYFYDTGAVRGDDGARYENAVALYLRKWLHFLEDTEGIATSLHYLRDKEGREVDFFVEREGMVPLLIEAKYADAAVAAPLRYHQQRIPNAMAMQLVHQLSTTRTVDGIQVTRACDWLAELPI